MRIDPILAKAARTTTAWAEYGAVCDLEPTDADGRIANTMDMPEYREWERAQDKAQKEWVNALSDVLATQPRTRKGAAAMIDAVLLWEGERLEGDHDDVLTLLQRLRTFLASN
jgi:hypothetical protein